MRLNSNSTLIKLPGIFKISAKPDLQYHLLFGIIQNSFRVKAGLSENLNISKNVTTLWISSVYAFFVQGSIMYCPVEFFVCQGARFQFQIPILPRLIS